MKLIGFKTTIACIFLAMNGGNTQAQSNETYTVHPPALSVPAGHAGETRRSISQYGDWTLICDEKKQINKMVCNVTQSIHDVKGNVVFSWSLAAAEDGRPFFLLRTLPETNVSQPVEIKFKNVKNPIQVEHFECDDNVCLAQVAVGSILNKQIESSAPAYIRYQLKNGSKLAFEAPFNGLKDAVASIN